MRDEEVLICIPGFVACVDPYVQADLIAGGVYATVMSGLRPSEELSNCSQGFKVKERGIQRYRKIGCYCLLSGTVTCLGIIAKGRGGNGLMRGMVVYIVGSGGGGQGPRTK